MLAAIACPREREKATDPGRARKVEAEEAEVILNLEEGPEMTQRRRRRTREAGEEGEEE